MDHIDRSSDEIQVFYVEDEAINVLVMEAVFRLRPRLRLIVAGNGHHAIEIAAGLKPSLLLLDLRLPDCLGAQLLAVLRHYVDWTGVPAIAVTAEPDFDVTGSGFLELWHKPIDIDDVLARLDALLLAPESEPAAEQAESSKNEPMQLPRPLVA